VSGASDPRRLLCCMGPNSDMSHISEGLPGCWQVYSGGERISIFSGPIRSRHLKFFRDPSSDMSHFSDGLQEYPQVFAGPGRSRLDTIRGWVIHP